MIMSQKPLMARKTTLMYLNGVQMKKTRLISRLNQLKNTKYNPRMSNTAPWNLSRPRLDPMVTVRKLKAPNQVKTSQEVPRLHFSRTGAPPTNT